MIEINSNKQIATWLFICAFMVLAMILIGGYTRLQGAGLSIVEWKPVTGVILPSSELAWQEEFSGYKNSPEYKSKNFGMTLAEFKRIYFIEYFHRLIGRVTGLIFVVPFLYFIWRRQLSSSSIKYLATVFVLGAAQGGLGWYMVKSGLYKNPHVSHYRLVMHLLAAILVYGLLIWKALEYSRFCHPRESGDPAFGAITKKVLDSRLRGNDTAWYVLTTLVLLQITLGGFVAGLKGGLVYNTFPLMDGQLVPRGLLQLQPWYVNFTENITMIQFLHRTLAIILIVYAWFLSTKIFLLVLAQALIGIATLVMVVPVHLALLHQLLAVLIFTNLLFVIHRLICWPYDKL